MRDKLKKERILITGGTGFFGKNLVKRLKKDDFSISIFQADLKQAKEIRNFILKIKPTTIYHLGAIVDLTRDFKTAEKCIDINIKGTLNLLESLRTNIPSRFIYTSTEEVYGNGPLPYEEYQLPNPPSPYAVSKIAAEQFARIYSQELRFSLFIFRVGTAYGPEQSLTRLIPQMIVKALKNEDIPLNSGTKKRDYIFIDDVIDALILANNKNINDNNATINLGGGVQYSLKELVSEIIRLTHSKSKILFGAFPDRILEADEWLLDNQKAFKILGWKPKTSLNEGLRQMIKYCRNALG